jgi:hypothetical protein
MACAVRVSNRCAGCLPWRPLTLFCYALGDATAYTTLPWGQHTPLEPQLRGSSGKEGVRVPTRSLWIPPPSGAVHSWLTVKEVDDPSISTEKHEKARFPMLLGIGCNRSPPPWCCGWKNGEFELTRPDNSELSLQWKSGGEQLVI